MESRILISAFEPFDGDSLNPSWEALRSLTPLPNNGEILRLLLPVSFREAPRLLREAVEKHKPQIVLSLGLAGGRSGFSLERIAVNLADARIPDNDGEQPRDLFLYPGEETAYLSTLPLGQLLNELEKESLPASLSNTAGLFVCNAVFYEAARLQARGRIRQAGFIHLPYLPEQAAEKNAPSMSLEDMVRGLNRVVERLLSQELA